MSSTQPTATAVYGTGRDADVPWHYGDPFGEQRALVGSAVVVDRRNRDVLTVGGPERLSWLHSICSQHVSGLTDGDSTEALVLSPNGHVEQHWQLTELGGAVWLDTEPGQAPTVLDYLTRMRFLKRVEPADVSRQWAVLTVLGPSSDDVLAAAGLPRPDGPGRAVAIAAGGFVRSVAGLSEPAVPAVDLVVPFEDADAVLARVRAAGARPAGLWAYEAARVLARRPRLGAETDHRTIPHEIGLIGPAVHLDKGCYRGQETVARVQNLGRPPRAMALAHLGGESDELPQPGEAVVADGRTVGFVGTAVQHHEYGPVALVVIKRTLVPEVGVDRSAAPTLLAGQHSLAVDGR